MDTIFMNTENIKTSMLHVLILNLTDLRSGGKSVVLSNLSVY